MARSVAGLPPGARLADYLTVGVVARYVPAATIRRILAETGTASRRQRDLPASAMVYYVIALALYMGVAYEEVLRCIVEGVHWLTGTGTPLPIAGKSGISQARTRLGVAPLAQLYTEVVRPLATPATPGAWYRQWRVVSLDGTTLDVADTPANSRAFGRPGSGRGRTAYPQVRFVTLAETGTRVLFGAALGDYSTGEISLARTVLPRLTPEMLCLADRNFYSYRLWGTAAATGAALLWRVKATVGLRRERDLPDGSYLCRTYPHNANRTRADKATDRGARWVRVIEYTVPDMPTAEARYRLVTTLLDPVAAPAAALAALYHERWQIETAFAEFKTSLRGPRVVLRSKTPALVRQEWYGLLLAHFAIRAVMHEAALAAPGGRDPDTLSFTHAVRVVRRTGPRFAAFPPDGPPDARPDPARRRPPGRRARGTARRARGA
jgi:hypothetical protein